VQSARIVADEDGGILEIHAVASPGRAPKQIARDIESMLVAKLGVPVDHRKISIAQVGDDAEVPPTETRVHEAVAPEAEGQLWPTDMRIEFVGVSVSQSHVKAEAQVELALGGFSTVAAVDGADSADSVLRLVAEATITAVQQLFDGRSILAVTAIEQTTVGGKPVVVVHVTHVREREEKHLIGACAISGDPTRAAALATLDAVNRFLRRLRPKEPTEYEIGPALES